MGVAHAVLAAQAADTIIGFLYDVHVQDLPTIASGTLAFAPNSVFDEYLDDQFETVSILGVEFLPSDVLFQLEPESYQAYLEEFLGQDWTADE